MKAVCYNLYMNVASLAVGFTLRHDCRGILKMRNFWRPFLLLNFWRESTHTHTHTHIYIYIYRVIRNDWQGCNNLSSTIHLRYQYVLAPLDLEVYVLSLPASIPELKKRIRTAIETITADMLRTVWKETRLSCWCL